MPRKHTAYFAGACQEGKDLHIFDRVRMLNHLKMRNITNILFNFSQALRAQFTCKASEEQEVECDELLK